MSQNQHSNARRAVNGNPSKQVEEQVKRVQAAWETLPLSARQSLLTSDLGKWIIPSVPLHPLSGSDEKQGKHMVCTAAERLTQTGSSRRWRWTFSGADKTVEYQELGLFIGDVTERELPADLIRLLPDPLSYEALDTTEGAEFTRRMFLLHGSDGDSAIECSLKEDHLIHTNRSELQARGLDQHQVSHTTSTYVLGLALAEDKHLYKSMAMLCMRFVLKHVPEAVRRSTVTELYEDDLQHLPVRPSIDLCRVLVSMIKRIAEARRPWKVQEIPLEVEKGGHVVRPPLAWLRDMDRHVGGDWCLMRMVYSSIEPTDFCALTCGPNTSVGIYERDPQGALEELKDALKVRTYGVQQI